jgi:hypothetical protein
LKVGFTGGPRKTFCLNRKQIMTQENAMKIAISRKIQSIDLLEGHHLK